MTDPESAQRGQPIAKTHADSQTNTLGSRTTGLE